MATSLSDRFYPHPLLRNRHAQTFAGYFVRGRQHAYHAHRRIVKLCDGDCIVVHDDRPLEWSAGDPCALLIHGLGGSHASVYMSRIASLLNERNIRAFRLDLRGCGAGMALARYTYHSGSTDDLRSALEAIGQWTDDSPTAVVGFSLGGNILLRMLGENPALVPKMLERALAVCSPVDLPATVSAIERPESRWYERHFLRTLLRQIEQRCRAFPQALSPDFPRRPQRMRDFDEYYTARIWGFGSADEYYDRCSAKPVLHQIDVPTMILSAQDDPLVPFSPIATARLSPTTQLVTTEHGGHMGFISQSFGTHADKRWMDWRVVDWIAECRPDRRSTGQKFFVRRSREWPFA